MIFSRRKFIKDGIKLTVIAPAVTLNSGINLKEPEPVEVDISQESQTGMSWSQDGVDFNIAYDQRGHAYIIRGFKIIDGVNNEYKVVIPWVDIDHTEKGPFIQNSKIRKSRKEILERFKK